VHQKNPPLFANWAIYPKNTEISGQKVTFYAATSEQNAPDAAHPQKTVFFYLHINQSVMAIKRGKCCLFHIFFSSVGTLCTVVALSLIKVGRILAETGLGHCEMRRL
jgi:hypothetical protein